MEQTFNTTSLSEQVEIALREEILSGRLAPRERISLSHYSKVWNVSPTPLRDAVRQLGAQGLVEISPRRGVFVAAIDRNALKEIFDLRLALECLAVRLATPLIPAEEAQRVLDLYKKAKNAAGPKERERSLSKIDNLVHTVVVQHCGNTRLKRMMEDLSDLVRWSQRTTIAHLREPYEATLPEHIQIAEAICARDPEAAAAAMHAHLSNTFERLDAMLAPRSKAKPQDEPGAAARDQSALRRWQCGSVAPGNSPRNVHARPDKAETHRCGRAPRRK